MTTALASFGTIEGELENEGFAVRDNMPESVYRLAKGWSQSQLKLLPNWPELFYGYHIAKLWEFKRTPDMELGTQLHGVLLEDNPLLIIPDHALTSNGQRRGKAWEDWKLSHPENPGILEKDAMRIRAMCESCRADPAILDLFKRPGFVEHSLFWIDKETCLRCKGRLDKIVFGSKANVILDVKCTSIDTTSEREVFKKIFEMGYHKQAAFYADAATAVYKKQHSFVFIFVRNKPPYTARAWMLNETDLSLGQRHNKIALRELMLRLDSEKWTGSGFGEIRTGSLPKYAYSDDPLDLSTPEPFEEFNEYH